MSTQNAESQNTGGPTGVVDALRSAVSGEVDAGVRRRAEYSTDASNYRVIPEVVVFPTSTEDVLAILRVAREHSTAITARGAGTSIAGNAVGTGIVIDFSRHLNKVLEIDPEARTARVQPGVVMSDLQKAAAPYGLRFGPDPSTQSRATLAGMIGNNACGPHAVAWGRTADNTISLDVVDGTGRRFTAGRGDLSALPGLEELVRDRLAMIRTEFGRFGRQVSGYSLEHLLPENGADLAKFLVGTEGSLVTVLEATVQLVPIPNAPVLLAAGYPDMPSAADAVPAMLAHSPLAVEGLDAELVEMVRRHQGDHAIPDLPEGAGWLLIEVGGADKDEALANARTIAADAGTDAVQIIPAGPEAAALWQIRADGAGLASRTLDGAQGWPGWEDAAVPPEKLGAYLRDFQRLMGEHGVSGLPYGHFGDGCIHIRIDFPLDPQDGAEGVALFRRFMFAAAELVAAHGGSLSGEHGDGRARGELLPLMYSPEAISTFEAVKAIFDPADLLNPGVVVRPRRVDEDLRRPHVQPLPLLAGSGFSFSHDGGDMGMAVHRCTGVGKCRADLPSSFMCPSYLATKDEKDSTRGRARVLQEMANGSLVQGWDSPEVHESLDLCLSCKACSSDCPTGIDMAQYKSEVTHRTYRGKVRPITHYALGWLPRWARMITTVPAVTKLVNAVLGVRPIGKLVLSLGGMDPRRSMVTFAEESLPRWWRKRKAPTAQSQGTPSGTARPEVLVWADSFSSYLDTDGGRAMVELLEAAGYTVRFPEASACCGLTWISTGQLDGARVRLRQTMDVLAPYVEAGIPIVGIEPSCTAALRSDLPDLFPDDPRAHLLAANTRTLAELLTADAPVGPRDWTPPDLTGTTVIAQPHCHHHAVIGYTTDLELLERTGAQVTTLTTCCGLAGNFGMESGHYDVSVAVAEQALLPALADAPADAVYLADGYSCRTQAEQLAGVRGVHLAQLLIGPGAVRRVGDADLRRPM
ncbi:FAD-binding and (Fe-S)-binding domain-containing protein [Ruania halotolerans]|uniref:FAD-binding and (Fe-S)-binding domain-containing protein n=1 Tax=Ruania halotolerans TaxID=2897773 RepID=UPI001E52D25D|nr:FAD-binding and (Fe-S)-binding domain-containing protein [Ruania halotolerans]UFU08312.1 FAD-binding oxidoreductase [Ruania halotolerans]